MRAGAGVHLGFRRGGGGGGGGDEGRRGRRQEGWRRQEEGCGFILRESCGRFREIFLFFPKRLAIPP